LPGVDPGRKEKEILSISTSKWNLSVQIGNSFVFCKNLMHTDYTWWNKAMFFLIKHSVNCFFSPPLGFLAFK
jgi:hypothetical protein